MTKRRKNSIDMKAPLVFAAVGLFAFFVSFGPSLAQINSATLDNVSAFFDADLRFEAALTSTLTHKSVADGVLLDPSVIKAFYTHRQLDPYWIKDSQLTRRADQFIKVLSLSWTHGLNPYAYHYEDIVRLKDSSDQKDKARLEVLLSDAFVRYARDLSGMRVDVQGLKMDENHWRQPAAADELIGMLRSDYDFNEIVRRIEPQGQTYKRLQKELVELVGSGLTAADQPREISFDGLMYPGWRHKSIPDLRARLQVHQQTSDPLLYDDRLAAAVITFQRENGLKEDGIIGSNTLQLLNRSKAARVRQVIANMERLRWLEESRPDKFVVVNIPAATLWAIDDARVEFEMPVIVGKPVRATLSFVTEIQGVRLNPTWTVPPTIKRYDILPKIQDDPDYLFHKGVELFRGYGRNAVSVDPDSIDWHNISRKDLNDLRMVQIPGDHNPLGRYRVLMPNIYNIYLHDTNHPELFDNPVRTLSSGCIRMKEPRRMAEFILESKVDWRDINMAAKIDNILATVKKTDIEIDDPIPVYVLYQTMWLDNADRLVYGTDYYNLDTKLIDKLAKIDGFFIPMHNDAIGSDRSELVLAQ